MKLKYLLRKAGNEFVKHAPGLAVAGGLVCLGVTVYETVRVTKKIEKEINYKKQAYQRDLTRREVGKIVLKNGWPVALMAACAGGCFIFAHLADRKKIAFLSTGLQMSNQALKSYQDVVLEELGKEKADEVHKKWVVGRAQERVDKIPDHEIPMPVLDTEYLFYEPITATPFISSFDDVYQAMRYVNTQLDSDPFGGPVPFREFLMSLPMKDACDADAGVMLGWLPKQRPGDTVIVTTDDTVATSKGPAWLIQYDPSPTWLNLEY